MWRLLRGDEYQGVTPRNLKLFLTAVLGLSFPWMYRDDEEEKMLESTVGDAIRARLDEAKKRSTASAVALQGALLTTDTVDNRLFTPTRVSFRDSSVEDARGGDLSGTRELKQTETQEDLGTERERDARRIGAFYGRGEFFLNHPSEAKRIHRKYHLLYENWSNVNARKSKSRSPEYKFRPSIDQHSKRIAREHADHTPSHDRLLHKGSEYERRMRTKQDEKKARELDSCTFKPHTTRLRQQILARRAAGSSPTLPPKDAATFCLALSNSSKDIGAKGSVERSPGKKRPKLSGNFSVPSTISVGKERTRTRGLDGEELAKTTSAAFNKYKRVQEGHPSRKINRKTVFQDEEYEEETPEQRGALPSHWKRQILQKHGISKQESEKRVESIASMEEEKAPVSQKHERKHFLIDEETSSLSPKDDYKSKESSPERFTPTQPPPPSRALKAHQNLPILFVDVKVGKNELKRITVREGDTAHGLATEFANTHGLSKDMRTKLELLLKQHMTSVLTKIDEIGEDEY